MVQRAEVPEIFQGQVPDDFYQEAIKKYRLPRTSQVAKFLNRTLFNRALEEPELTDSFVRSLYKQALAEAAEAAARHQYEQDKYDELTHLLNRKYLRKSADELLDSVGGHRPADPVSAVAFKIDIVGFKEINDTKKYQAGDLSLVATAEFLRESVRGTDLIGRWGGDEFVIVAPTATGSTDEEVKQIIEKRLNGVPSSDTFPKQLRWGSSFYRPGDNLQKMIDSIDINTEAGKRAAMYSQTNPAYSIH